MKTNYLIILLGILGSFFAETSEIDCGLPKDTLINRPGDLSRPTEINVGIFVINISQVRDIDLAFEADILLKLSWQDSRLVGLPAACSRVIESIWNPKISILNSGGIKKRSEELTISPQGKILYEQRLFGKLSAPIDLKDFPFDSQTLPIEVVSNSYTPEQIKLVFAKSLTGQAESFTIIDWFIGEPSLESSLFYYAPTKQNFPVLIYKFTAQRYSSFYLWKNIVPILIFLIISWVVFYIDPRELAAQMALVATVMVMMVAFQFSLSVNLPVVPYLTRLDIFVLGAQILVAAALLEAVVTGILAAKNYFKFAAKIDLVSRFLFPIGLLALMIKAFGVF